MAFSKLSTERKWWQIMNLEKRDRREREILEQAEYLIKTYGYDCTSMQQIAFKCGLAVGTLYNYFPSKNDILITIFENLISDILNKSENILLTPGSNLQDNFAVLFGEYCKCFTYFSKDLWVKFLADTAVKIDLVNIDGSLWRSFERLRIQIRTMIIILKENKVIDQTINEDILSTLMFNLYYLHLREYIYSNYTVDQILEKMMDQIKIIISGIKFNKGEIV